jgi:hypothetical protein
MYAHMLTDQINHLTGLRYLTWLEQDGEDAIAMDLERGKAVFWHYENLVCFGCVHLCYAEAGCNTLTK